LFTALDLIDISLLKSIGRNALSDYGPIRSVNKEVVGKIIDIQRERTAVTVAPVAQGKRFTQVAYALEISARVVQPYSVGELESLMCCFRPRTKTNISLSWINVWVVNFSPASIPDLVSLLDLLSVHQETNVPESNYGSVGGIIVRSRRLSLNQRLLCPRLALDRSRCGCHCFERITALSHRGRAEAGHEHQQGRNPDCRKVTDRFQDPDSLFVHFVFNPPYE
jgi:hypothetical protein